MDTFDEKLLQSVDKTLKYVLGDINAGIIFDYLEKKGCTLNEIPAKLDLFSMELENLVGSGKGQFLGVAPILEEAILKSLSAELKIEFDNKSPGSFASHVERLREINYAKKRNECIKNGIREQYTQTYPVPNTTTSAGERR